MAWKKISETHYQKTTYWGTTSVSINRFRDMWNFQIKTADGKKSEEEFPTKKQAMSAMKLYMHLNSFGEVVEGRSGKGNKHGGKGWHGEHQRHKEVAERAQAKHARNTPMTRTQQEIRLRLIHEHQHHDPTTGFMEWNPNTPQHIKDLEKDILKEQTKKQGYFIMIEDRMGNITLSHSGSKRVAFFQAESDKEFISDLLKKGEKEDMENGYDVKINDSEPRASVLSELWEASGGG